MSLKDHLKRQHGIEVEQKPLTAEEQKVRDDYNKEVYNVKIVVKQPIPTADLIRVELVKKCRQLLAKEGREFRLDEDSKRLINIVSLYFARDERFFKYCTNGSFHKGIYLVGRCGVGKTLIMTAAKALRIPEGKFGFISCNQVVNEYNTKGRERGGIIEVQKYMKRSWCFDDLGTEPMGNSYGKEDVFTTLLTQRAELYTSNQMRTFITSNFVPDDLQARYGERIVSRIHQMCNIIAIGGNDRRKESN